MSMLVNVLHPASRTLVAHKQANKTEKGNDIAFDDVVEAACDIGESGKGRNHQYKNISTRSSSSPAPTDQLAKLATVTAHTKNNLAEPTQVLIDTSRTIIDVNRFN